MIAMAEPALGTTRPWIGKLFALFGILWFGAVFWVMRPDLPSIEPRPTPILVFPDGTKYKVYLPSEILGAEANWVERVDIQVQYTYWDFMRRPIIRFLMIAMGPPAAVLFGSLAWLGITEFQVRRKLPPGLRE
jgi:hypothetical protein